MILFINIFINAYKHRGIIVYNLPFGQMDKINHLTIIGVYLSALVVFISNYLLFKNNKGISPINSYKPF